jgi:phosphoglycolate phosphatase-like HAD superfamily hydrolase
MSSHDLGSGPDLAIVGAARSGTTQLAARLSRHPAIDASAVKEPNYFSREFERGPEWYDAYFQPRSESRVRLDASVSYTYPQYPEALERLVAASPHVYVVYVVRDPVERAVSHYRLNHHYFGHESANDFGSALADRSFYLDVGDYERWLEALGEHVPAERRLVVPFAAVTSHPEDVAEVVFRALHLPSPTEVDDEALAAHQNNVVAFRSEAARRVTRILRHSRAYPHVRRALGPDRMKRLRALVTREPEMASVEEALASCNDAQLLQLADVAERGHAAALQELRRQDDDLGLAWAAQWPPPREVTSARADPR